ncbi:MAG TPA: transaldolase [Anaeromyxobacter sp.]|nr:transaldolase [Anaeromyxobacter sp.]
MPNPLRELGRLGQSPWYDSLRRSMLLTGELARLIEDDGLTGLTTNPAIYEKAIAGGHDYDADLASLGSRRDLDAKGLYELLAIQDIRAAADLLRPVYDRSAGQDGYVSLEVSPDLAGDADGTVAEARRLWRALDRENVLVKVPGTPEAVPAIRSLLTEGVNVNVTLIFSRKAYARVAEAHLAALEERAARGLDLSRVASVASFFVSRVDGAVDALLEQRVDRAASPRERARAEALLGKAGIANAKLAYQDWRALSASARWARVAALGAMPQRLLWASTSTKSPRYRDVLYVEELIGPQTVNTMPPATFDAFRDHGRVSLTLESDLGAARAALAELQALGISLDRVTARLLADGIRLFQEPFRKLLAAVEARRGQAAAAEGARASPA